MKTDRGIKASDYIGADLTDRYSNARRAIDVCGLICDEKNRLHADFWKWNWPAPQSKLDPASIAAIVAEVNSARSTMLDGPQGFASIGRKMRECERLCGAVGKTPDKKPQLNQPFAGYILSSIELFSAFAQAGVNVSPPGFRGGVSEVYPGDIWSRLVIPTRALPRKKLTDGRRARKLILEALGVVNLPDKPTDDENDACISAVMAAAAHGNVPGVAVSGLGLPLVTEEGGILREGQMVIPSISRDVLMRIEENLVDIPNPLLNPANHQGVAQEVINTPNPLNNPATHQGVAQEVMDRAIELNHELIQRALHGNAGIINYKTAYQVIFNLPNLERWAQAFGQKVVLVAENVPIAHLPGLGAVRLDTFIVRSRTHMPGDRHWNDAHYEREDWERVLGNATILSYNDLINLLNHP